MTNLTTGNLTTGELSLDSLFSVRGKVVLVTGGSRGIGEMIAAGFLANGAKVYISSRKADVCDATAARLVGDLRRRVHLDPRRSRRARRHRRLAGGTRRAASRASTCWSTTPACRGERRVDEFPEIGWDKVMDTNVKGVFFLTQRLLPLLEAGATADEPARVINIGSIDGIRTPGVRHGVLRAVEGRRAHAHEPARRPSSSSATSC